MLYVFFKIKKHAHKKKTKKQANMYSHFNILSKKKHFKAAYQTHYNAAKMQHNPCQLLYDSTNKTLSMPIPI